MEKNSLNARLFYRFFQKSEEQTEHKAAHALLSQVLANLYGISNPRILRDDHGKPYLPDFPVHFNLSHCSGLVVCAVGNCPLGVDAEKIRPLRERVMGRCLSPEEIAAVESSPDPDARFFQHWTLKESYVKAIGVGISYPMKNVTFSWQKGRIIGSPADWQFCQFQVQSHWLISCCTPKGCPVSLEGEYPCD